ncbi:hypothetical protein Plec18167_003912 [Paecilomyces lecythidis]|uniref:SnoaL-like domain-containing protein n=1 Tax=Paecilomyces lecythidis TaxID=3004212 RepID=A0ABR3XV28_9EURO
MSSTKHTPRSILNAFYAAERVYMSAPSDRRDFSAMGALISPDCRLEQTSGLPYAGTYVGPSGMQDWSEQMANYFSVVDVKEPEIFEREGSSRIVVVSTVHFRVRKTGEDLHYPFCQVVTVDLDKGQITEMRPFYWDVYDVNRALGIKK